MWKGDAHFAFLDESPHSFSETDLISVTPNNRCVQIASGFLPIPELPIPDIVLHIFERGTDVRQLKIVDSTRPVRRQVCDDAAFH